MLVFGGVGETSGSQSQRFGSSLPNHRTIPPHSPLHCSLPVWEGFERWSWDPWHKRSKTILAFKPHIPFSDMFHKVPTSNQMVFQVGAIVEVVNPTHYLKKSAVLDSRLIGQTKNWSDSRRNKLKALSSVPWSKVAILGMVIPPLIGIRIMGI